MAVLLPLSVFLMLWRIFALRGDYLREALLRAAIISITLLAVMTELLSIPFLLTRTSVIVAWLLASLVTFTLLRRYGRRPGLSVLPSRSSLLPPDLLSRGLLAAIVVDLAIVGLIAIIAPPNTSDAVEYHLPRVIFWVSNHTLRIYPTADYAQLVQAPGAEFVTLHSYLLWGSDRLANLTEFFSLIGSAIGASLIAKRLGADRTGQLLSALFVVTIPEALLESSGSMTTGVVSFWIVASCYFVLRAGETLLIWDLVFAGLAAGLALLTKGIAYVYLPFLLLGCIRIGSKSSRIWLLKRVPLLAVIALTLSAGQFIRAYQVTGTPLGAPFPAGGPRLNFATGRITPGSVAAGVVRQITLHTQTPVNKINTAIEILARLAIRSVGENPDDQQQIWLGYRYFVDHPTRLETQAGNPLHFVIVVVVFMVAIPLRRRFTTGLLRYVAGIVLAFVIFCGFIRWQPWGSRFHLPLFVLSSAVVGLVIRRILSKQWQVACFAGCLFVAALPYLLSNSPRSILRTKGFATIFQPRSLLLVADHHLELASDYSETARAVRASRCSSIAIDAYIPIPDDQIINSPPGFLIYPLLAQLQIDGTNHTAHYIGVNNLTKNYPTGQHSGPECVIVCLSCTLSQGHQSYANLGATTTYGMNEVTIVSGAPK